MAAGLRIARCSARSEFPASKQCTGQGSTDVGFTMKRAILVCFVKKPRMLSQQAENIPTAPYPKMRPRIPIAILKCYKPEYRYKMACRTWRRHQRTAGKSDWKL